MRWFQQADLKAKLLAALLAVAAAVTVTITVFDDDEDGKPDRVTVTIQGKTATVPIDADQQRDATDLKAESDPALKPGQAEGGADIAIHEDTRDEIVPGVDAQDVEQAQEPAKGLKRPQQLGGAQNYSCPNAYVRNQSGLNGRRSGAALHFTVSVPGSLLAIRGLFDRLSFGASSNNGIELTGRCQTWVPWNRKAWAQGAFNSAYISTEIITFDRTRAQWLAAPIIKRGILASLVADQLKYSGSRPRLVNPVGCTPLAGYTDHERLECGNTHWDVGKRFPWDVFGQQVQRAYYGGNPVKPAPRPIAARWHSRCKRLNATRAKIKAGEHVSTAERLKARELRAVLVKGGYRCSGSRAVRK